MADVPNFSDFNSEAVPAEHRQWMGDAVFRNLNEFGKGTVAALGNNLTFAKNMAAQVLTLSVTVPTDWISVPDASLASGWSTFSAGISRGAQYRKDANGRVTWGGLLKCTAPANYTSLFVPPAAFLPAALSPCITGISAGNVGGTDSFCSMEVSSQYGLRYRSGAVANSYVSLEGIGYYCSDFSPYIPSCWPVLAKWTLRTPPALLWLANLVDITTSTRQKLPLTGAVDWEFASGTQRDSNGQAISQVKINSILGLLPGHKYSATIIAATG